MRSNFRLQLEVLELLTRRPPSPDDMNRQLCIGVHVFPCFAPAIHLREHEVLSPATPSLNGDHHDFFV